MASNSINVFTIFNDEQFILTNYFTILPFQERSDMLELKTTQRRLGCSSPLIYARMNHRANKRTPSLINTGEKTRHVFLGE